MMSGGVDALEIFTCDPVLLSLLEAVKKEFGKGSVQYSGTRGSHGPRVWTVCTINNNKNTVNMLATTIAKSLFQFAIRDPTWRARVTVQSTCTDMTLEHELAVVY